MDLKTQLDGLVASHDRAKHVANDPVGLVHTFSDPRDQELVGLIAALLAFGQVKSIRRSVNEVLRRLGSLDVVGRATSSELRRKLRGFVHRVWTGEDVAQLLTNAAALRSGGNSLGEALSRTGTMRDALTAFADQLRGEATSRSMKHLVPDPRAGSACKRLLLYLRWMIRPADGVDLGVWHHDRARLLIPVDTHIFRIAKNLNLTKRRTASWAAAEEITASLRQLDPADPVKYDFALCHLGVSRQCPSRQDPEKCGVCVLQAVCSVWTSRHRLARSSALG